MEVRDSLLALGFTLRLTRLVISDHLGVWFIQEPAERWANKSTSRDVDKLTYQQKLVAGLECPYCVGFWIGCLVLLSLFVSRSNSRAATLWRYTAGAFALNYVAGHISAKVD